VPDILAIVSPQAAAKNRPAAYAPEIFALNQGPKFARFDPVKIALDAMGGDFGPPNLVAGAVMALREYQHIRKLFLVGDSAKIEAELKKHACNDGRIDIVHASQVVEMSDGAVQSVRRKKDSSVSRAVDLVKHGAADAIVSGGHTGAAVAATLIKLRTLPGIERPGIASLIPTEMNVFVLIDAGANVDARPMHLVQYGIMGSVYSRHVLGYQNPTVGLMSIGDEDVKGKGLTKEVFKLLKESSLNFRGNIEGHDLFENPCEVVLCDGFVGNVVLKTCEAIAHAIFTWLKHELRKSPTRLIGAAMAKGAFKAIHKKTNWEDYGGSPLLGVNGICIIAHGASTPLAVKNALRVAAESIEQQVNPHIIEEVRRYNETTASLEPALR
jgi:glycerol-3-phosphate acyltransferase PlsX